MPTAAVTKRCEMRATGMNSSRSNAWYDAKHVAIKSSSVTAGPSRSSASSVSRSIPATAATPIATVSEVVARTSLTASVFAKYPLEAAAIAGNLAREDGVLPEVARASSPGSRTRARR